MYESRKQPLIPAHRFAQRMLVHVAIAMLLVLASLGLGMAGYAAFEGLHWRDAFLNAAMLLGGMGPVDMPKTDAGKLFAGLYALYAGLVFIVVSGLLLAPALHRLMHRFHLEGKN